jgi:hypothetical protein
MQHNIWADHQVFHFHADAELWMRSRAVEFFHLQSAFSLRHTSNKEGILGSTMLIIFIHINAIKEKLFIS